MEEGIVMYTEDAVEIRNMIGKKLRNPATKPEEKSRLLKEYSDICKIINDDVKSSIIEERTRIEWAKTENEARKIEMASAKAEQNAKNAFKESVIENVVDFGKAVLATGTTIYGFTLIAGAEKSDRLVNSKVIGFIPKLLSGFKF